MAGTVAEIDRQPMEQAALRNTAAVLSLPSAALVRNFQSRFLGVSDDGVLMEAPGESLLLAGELCRTGGEVSVAFKSDNRRLIFSSAVLAVDPARVITSELTLPVLLLALPEQIREEQRRRSYRVRIGGEEGLSVKLWTISERAHISDKPLTSQSLAAELVDISTGGLGLRLLPMPNKAFAPVDAQRVRVEIVYQKEPLLLEGRLRVGEPPVCGVAFSKLETDLAGRRMLATLTRIIGELQRNEVRRTRLGMQK